MDDTLKDKLRSLAQDYNNYGDTLYKMLELLEELIDEELDGEFDDED